MVVLSLLLLAIATSNVLALPTKSKGNKPCDPEVVTLDSSTDSDSPVMCDKDGIPIASPYNPKPSSSGTATNPRKPELKDSYTQTGGQFGHCSGCGKSLARTEGMSGTGPHVPPPKKPDTANRYVPSNSGYLRGAGVPKGRGKHLNKRPRNKRFVKQIFGVLKPVAGGALAGLVTSGQQKGSCLIAK